MVQYTAEIITMGNELLIGRTVDTNSTYLALHLTKHGFKVERVTTVRDEVKAASTAINEVLSRRPNILLISGGLGPTHDDIQMEVLSDALSIPLVEHPDAIKLLKEKYGSISPARRKMAHLPTGSIALKNQVGSAPGAITSTEHTDIISLPGVPAEMKDIFEFQVIPYLAKKYMSGKLIEYGFNAYGAYESGIIELTKSLLLEFPKVNFKSHPKKLDSSYYLSLHVYAITDEEESVKTAATRWKEEIEKRFGTDVKTTEIAPVFEDQYIPELSKL